MWHPALYAEIDEMVQAAELQMEPAVQAFWGRISVVPQKWQLPIWGDAGGGFWVVALMGQECIYFNDIEDGFNVGQFDTLGIIRYYGCEQDELEHCIRFYYEAFTKAIASAV